MLMSLSEEEFIIELKKRFGSYLGEIELEGERKSYPLSFIALLIIVQKE